MVSFVFRNWIHHQSSQIKMARMCDGYDANIRKMTSRKCNKSAMDGSCYCQKHAECEKRARIECPGKLPIGDINRDLKTYNWPTRWPVLKGELRWYAQEIMRKSIEEQAKKILMASRIKRLFKRSISDPNHKMCRDRLQREFEEL